MSQNLSPASPIRPLSIGNVVSAGIRLYRSNLKTYFQLALIAYVWILVPVYGWAKYAAISGQISRLTFGELINKPESPSAAQSKTDPKMWSFLRVAFQVWISLFLVYLGLAFASGFIISAIVAIPLSAVLGPVATIPVIIIFLGIVIAGFTWFFSRWSVAEVPLAVEEGLNGAQSVARSWELTKTSVFRIQGIVFVAFLVTLPLLALTSYLPQLFFINLEPGSPLFWVMYLFSLVLSLLGGAVIMPFWQAIKAVIYYDLRSRREGMGLGLRDRGT